MRCTLPANLVVINKELWLFFFIRSVVEGRFFKTNLKECRVSFQCNFKRVKERWKSVLLLFKISTVEILGLLLGSKCVWSRQQNEGVLVWFIDLISWIMECLSAVCRMFLKSWLLVLCWTIFCNLWPRHKPTFDRIYT